LKIFGLFIFIYGWFILYDTGLSIDGALCLLFGMAIISFEEILAHVQWRRYHNDK
jgi:hypothetical protein